MAESFERNDRPDGRRAMRFVGVLALCVVLPTAAAAQLVLPRPDHTFAGIANRTLQGSKPDYVEPVRAPRGAPNILLVLIDDTGFGNPSTFGGPIHTPTLDRIAEQGLRYNRFHVAALCSPTRAALLSGRNHHSMHFGSIAEAHSGWPGYDALWPKAAVSVAEVLRQNGYSTAAFGKWHLTPDDQQGPAGPFDRWPNALGFDYFWGFLGGETGQYDPLLVENNRIIGVPTQKGFYFPDAMADRAVRWIRDQKAQAPDKPFFVYFATGASHAPHQVPNEWSSRYRGKFDGGWDKYREETFARQKKLGVIPADAKLTPRPAALPAWDSLPPEQKKLYARQMEVYAGFTENADYQVGRVVGAIDDLGYGDDTLIIYIFGDNGASMEGTETGSFNELTVLNGIPLTPEQQLQAIEAYGGLDVWGTARTHPHYSAAWAWAGNTPFQWGKQVASHLGGIRDPMVIAWPQRIKDKHGLRSQFIHVTDITPTILEVAGIPAPQQVNGIAQMPMDGVSFVPTFDDANAPERHTQQYFEMLGNRAMYKDGWLASCRLPRVPWKIDLDTIARFAPGAWNPEKDPCELYHLDEDFSQADDLASKYPAKLDELKTLFWAEAEKYHVLPLLGSMAVAWGIRPPDTGHTVFRYSQGTENIAPGMIPNIYNRSYAISADLDIQRNTCLLWWCFGTDGVIVANGSFLGGFSLYVQGGKLRHTYSFEGLKIDTIIASKPLPTGKVNVRYEFTADTPGKMATGGTSRLFVNGEQVAEGRIEHTVPLRFSGFAGMDIGRDNGLPVSPNYYYYWKSPFPFAGKIEKVEFTLQPLPARAGDEESTRRYG
jgi:arylsulfatase A-like enzyme